jgi:hypothetical protein
MVILPTGNFHTCEGVKDSAPLFTWRIAGLYGCGWFHTCEGVEVTPAPHWPTTMMATLFHTCEGVEVAPAPAGHSASLPMRCSMAERMGCEPNHAARCGSGGTIPGLKLTMTLLNLRASV